MSDELGLDKEEVRLLPHNPHWIALGQQECVAVCGLLGDMARDVVHVGSTAVPGIEAKPILDIAAAVDDDARIDDIVWRLCAAGDYSYEGDKREDGGFFFVRGHGGFRIVHVHVVGVGSHAWSDYLQFRTVLVDDAAARDRYKSEKRRLAHRFPRDRPGYTHAKSAVVEELLAPNRESPAAHQG
jgi:GrpB-like predicted nucleotidyltransferase (UPF0157 family)